MITSLHLRDFKNFADETLRVGPFTVIIGTNASGKSNIRDAFRFLHGVGRGYTLAEIIGGRHGASGQVEWEPIRGAASELIRFGKTEFSIGAEFKLANQAKAAHYEITVGFDESDRGGFRVRREELRIGNQAIYSTHPPHPDPVRQQDDETHLLLRMAKTGDQRRYGNKIAVRWNQPALTQLQNFKHLVRVVHKEKAEEITELLGRCRFLDPSPDLMRHPAFPGQMVLGDSGENLPTVLQEICAGEERRKVFSEWVRELTPMDVADFNFPRDPVTGLVQLVIREQNDRKISAHSASDGTLRFLAMLAALLDENPARLYVFEEIDNGIHPSRLHLLVDLIERQTAKGTLRVVTTTHSPELISIVNDAVFRDMSVVCRMEDSEDSVIRLVSSMSDAEKLRKTQGLGRLLAGGWMETALAFTEGREDKEASL